VGIGSSNGRPCGDDQRLRADRHDRADSVHRVDLKGLRHRRVARVTATGALLAACSGWLAAQSKRTAERRFPQRVSACARPSGSRSASSAACARTSLGVRMPSSMRARLPAGIGASASKAMVARAIEPSTMTGKSQARTGGQSGLPTICFATRQGIGAAVRPARGRSSRFRASLAEMSAIWSTKLPRRCAAGHPR
jgi:hypothetical protein